MITVYDEAGGVFCAMAEHKMVCTGCPNACRLMVYRAEDGGITVMGNRCGVGTNVAREALSKPVQACVKSGPQADQS